MKDKFFKGLFKLPEWAKKDTLNVALEVLVQEGVSFDRTELVNTLFEYGSEKLRKKGVKRGGKTYLRKLDSLMIKKVRDIIKNVRYVKGLIEDENSVVEQYSLTCRSDEIGYVIETEDRQSLEGHLAGEVYSTKTITSDSPIIRSVITPVTAAWKIRPEYADGYIIHGEDGSFSC